MIGKANITGRKPCMNTKTTRKGFFTYDVTFSGRVKFISAKTVIFSFHQFNREASLLSPSWESPSYFCFQYLSPSVPPPTAYNPNPPSFPPSLLINRHTPPWHLQGATQLLKKRRALIWSRPIFPFHPILMIPVFTHLLHRSLLTWMSFVVATNQEYQLYTQRI